MGGSANAGIGRYSFELLTKLLEDGRDSYYVFYHEKNCSPDDIAALRQRGAILVPANFRHYSWAEQIRFPRLLKSYGLDIVHFPNFNVPILYKGDYVVTIHDMVHHKISGHKRSTYYKFLAYKYIIQQAAQRAKKIITVTNSAKKDIVDILNVDPNRVAVTYEAPDRFEGELASFENLQKTFMLSRPYLLFVGTLERKKNIVGLAKGFDLFLKKYKYDMDLVIAGRADAHYPEIRHQALEITHKNNLVFTGFVSNSEQASLYRNAFAFITASLHEGFGLPALEAMQYGVPVLASNTEVFNEVYDNAAIYFDALNPEDIADKINLLVADQPFYESMQKKSLDRSALFDWKETARLTSEIYHQVKQKDFAPEIE